MPPRSLGRALQLHPSRPSARLIGPGRGGSASVAARRSPSHQFGAYLLRRCGYFASAGVDVGLTGTSDGNGDVAGGDSGCECSLLVRARRHVCARAHCGCQWEASRGCPPAGARGYWLRVVEPTTQHGPQRTSQAVLVQLLDSDGLAWRLQSHAGAAGRSYASPRFCTVRPFLF